MDGVDDAADRRGADEPWHVPDVPSGEGAEPAEDVPPAVIDAAKRALHARRPDVGVLDLTEQSVDPADGGSCFQFSDGLTSVEVRSHPQGVTLWLEIRCPQHAGDRVEVLHGGATAVVTLDDDGAAEVQVSPGPLSLVLFSAYPPLSPAQTMWVRLS